MHMRQTEQHYQLITNPQDIDNLLKIEAAIFKLETFHYERDFLTYPFQSIFDTHIFFENHDFFRDQNKFHCLIKFLKDIKVSSFYISAPQYCGLYPLRISIECPYKVYESAVSYILDETVFNANQQQIIQPIGHPMRGAGFVIMPQVFVYVETREWALVLEDSITPVAVTGLRKDIYDAFVTNLRSFQLMSISELVDARSKEKYLVRLDNNLVKDYTIHSH